MATFSLGGGVTPGAPGVYINERAGVVANADIANFSTVYMLVETPETVPVTVFPYNTPTPVTSLNDYFALVGGSVPESRIPLLSYNCVNEFFQNAQVGDLRVVRVGTPDQIVEIEILPNGTKQSNAGLPSNFEAGDVVYAQLVINGNRLVAGDGSTGYNADGEWLGVPVTIPVDYIAGDEVNNRRISSAIATAIAEAIESNPSVRSAVYVRDFGLVTTINPLSNSENAFVSIAASTFDANVSVVPLVLPVGAQYVMMQNVYNIQNIVGQQQNLERVPQDYIQCINTAFDGQQDQGYLITPTAYAQFDADGRAAIGAAAAEHCANNNYKWMALADPGPFLVTDVNKYSVYTPHQPAANLVTGLKYLVDNAMYEWTGADVTYDKLTYQALIASPTAETAVTQSKTATPVAAGEKVGLLDSASFEVDSIVGDTMVVLDVQNYWPVSYQIQEVTFSGATGDILSTIGEDGTIFVVAPPYDLTATGDYSFNNVFFALDASSAVAVLNEVIAAGGSINLTTPVNAVDFGGSVGTCNLTYVVPFYNLPQTINGQTSNLLQNITGAAQYVNTLHLPASIQEATANYRLNFVSRTILDPDASVAGSTGPYTGAAQITCVGHGLTNGQKLYFTQPVKTNLGANLFRATTKISEVLYYVKVIDADTFSLAESLTAYTSGAFVTIPSGTSSLVSSPTIFYTKVLGGEATSATLAELSVVPFIRGRKYGLNSGQIASEASVADAAPAPATSNPAVSIFFNNSLTALGVGLVSPFGENPTAGWLPKLTLTAPGSSSTTLENWYCTPTVDQNFASQAFLVPSVEPILGGSYNPTGTSTKGPISTLGSVTGGTGYTNGTYLNVALTGGTGSGATADITVAAGIVTVVTLTNGGFGYTAADSLSAPTSVIGSGTLFAVPVGAITAGIGILSLAKPYAQAAGLVNGSGRVDFQGQITKLTGVYFDVITASGFAPDGTTPVIIGDRIAVIYNGSSYSWAVVPADGDLSTVGQPCYGSQVGLDFTPETTPPSILWRFDPITSTEIINDALRGVGFNGVPQAEFIEAGVDNVNRLYTDSQRYFQPFGFIAYYGPYIENASGQWIPPSPYVTGIALRRYRAEGYQFPPAGVKYQLADAVAAQIPINSAQQNLLNPDGCNAIRTLPGYPTSAVFVWGGRTRVNSDDAQQRLYQFVNTRVILNVVYGSLRNAFDSQIFNVIDGFGVAFNQIISVGNSVLNQLYSRGALFGARPSDAFQVICDSRINPPASLENGIVNAKVFVTPVPTLERIQIDLIRVAIGQMQNELNAQGLGTNNTGF
jgi:hypothetical protein